MLSYKKNCNFCSINHFLKHLDQPVLKFVNFKLWFDLKNV